MLARYNPGVKNNTPYVSGNSDSQGLAVGDIQTIANFSNPNQASAGIIVNLASGSVKVRSDQGGFTTVIGGDGNFGGDWAYNVLNYGAGTSDLFQSNPGNSLTQKGVYDGNFVLDSAGNLAFNVAAVPEPSTWAMLGVGFASLMGVRRFKALNKNN